MDGTRLYLIRHASHDLLGRVLVGRAPVSISATGRREAEAVANALSDAGLSAVLSSPQNRARQTAEIIAARVGRVVIDEPGLDELDFGTWTGATFASLHSDPAWQAFNIFRGSALIPDGETMLSVQARAVNSVLRLRACHPGASLALVSHADVLKSILAHFLGTSLDLMRRIELSPASRSVIDVYDQDAVVRAINVPTFCPAAV